MNQEKVERMPSPFDQRQVRLNSRENIKTCLRGSNYMNMARKTQHKIGNSLEPKLRHK